MNVLGQNMTSGVYTRTEKTKQKMRLSHKGHIVTNETRNKMSLAHTGKVVTNETKRKLSLAKTGGIHQNKSKKDVFSKETLEFLNGELLGDGHLHEYSFVAKYSHTSKYRHYIEWLRDKLLSFGIIPSGEILEYSYNTFKDKRYENTIYTSFRYNSKSYPELKELRKKWYPSPEFVKRVPSDITLSPITLRQWYIGDGYNGAPEGNGILIFIPSFPTEDRKLLMDNLSELGLHPNFQGNKTRIHIGMQYIDDFLDYIGPCPVECYDYKWDKYNYKNR